MDTAVGEGVVKGDGMDVKAAVCDHFSPTPPIFQTTLSCTWFCYGCKGIFPLPHSVMPLP